MANIHGTNNDDNLIGTPNDDNIYGHGGDDTLNGGNGHDLLFGGNGTDILIGGRGVNDLWGGEGADTIVMEDRASAGGFSDDLIRDFVPGEDQVDVSAWGVSDLGQIEALLTVDSHGRAGLNAYYDGFDHVLRFGGLEPSELSAADFIFSDAGAKNETGTNFDDVMFGSGEGDTLDGAAGFDVLLGGGGKDTLSGGFDRDFFDGGTGHDTVSYAYTDEAVDMNLRKDRAIFATDTKERLISIESATGSDGVNVILGSSGNNTLSGLDGDDTLNGLRGTDTLIGGDGNDRFVFDTPIAPDNIDTVDDLAPGVDEIRLSSSVFTALSDGPLDAAAFTVNNTGNADDASDRIIYNDATGGLYYDDDGAGGAASVLFAQLDAGLGATISHDDFFVT